LRKRPEERKVLFVLSDGYPAHMSDASNTEIVRHCKEAIKTGKKDGIECIGIGICSDAVTKIYDQNVVVHDVAELSSSVFMTLTKLLVGTP
jgi:cobalamin biosynthesis protein CobT